MNRTLMWSLLAPLMGMLVPLLSGFMANRVTDVLKLANKGLDQGPAWIKQLVVVGLSAGLVVIGNLVGLTLNPAAVGSDLNIDQTTLEALIAAMVAFFLKGQQQTKRVEKMLGRGLDEVTSNVFDLEKTVYHPDAPRRFDPGA